MPLIPILDLPQITDERWEQLTDPPPWDPIEENQISMEDLLNQA